MAICKKCGKVMNKGITLHEKYCKGKIESGNIEPSIKNLNESHIDRPKIGQSNTNKKIDEVNLMPEYETNKEKIESVKKEEKKEEDYQCGSCQATFTKKHKFCPECGVEFD